jgi:hypothetical protein
MRVIYQLAHEFKLEDPRLPTVIEHVAKATKGKKKTIPVREARGLIRMALIKIEHGDYPRATLQALDDLPDDARWVPAVIEQLKTERPDTDKAAQQIVATAHRAHLATRYGIEPPTMYRRLVSTNLERSRRTFGLRCCRSFRLWKGRLMTRRSASRSALPSARRGQSERTSPKKKARSKNGRKRRRPSTLSARKRMKIIESDRCGKPGGDR